MNNDLSIIEKQYADIRAAEYLGRGYEVLRDLPLEFLPGYRADLVVKFGSCTKVIVVKTRPSVAANPALQEYERIINSQPGWRFELELVNEPDRLDVVPNVAALDEGAILTRLTHAATIRDVGLPDAAFILAWSAAEATLRMMVKAEGIDVDRATDSAYLLDMAVAHGTIGREDYRRLNRAMQSRNAIAHGFEVENFDGAMVEELSEQIRLLLSEHHDWVESAAKRTT